MSAVPAIAKNRAQGVFARLEQVGHVVGLVARADVIIGPAGGQQRVSHPLTVQRGFVQPQRGDIEPGADRWFLQVKSFAQIRHGDSRARRTDQEGANPIGAPVGGLQQAHLEPVGLAPVGWLTAFIPNADAPRYALSGAEGRPGVFESRLRRRCTMSLRLKPCQFKPQARNTAEFAPGGERGSFGKNIVVVSFDGIENALIKGRSGPNGQLAVALEEWNAFF